MTRVAREHAAFWMSDWPDEVVVAEMLLRLCGCEGIQEVETATNGGWRTTRVELGRLRAAYRLGKELPGGVAVRAEGLELQVRSSLGCAPGWAAAGVVECSSAEQILESLGALGAGLGARTSASGRVSAFRRRDLERPELPGGASEARGPWFWSEPLEDPQLESWMRAIALILHGGTDGDGSAASPGTGKPLRSSSMAHSRKACHAIATTSAPALPSFMRGSDASRMQMPDDRGATDVHVEKPPTQVARREAPEDASTDETEALDLAKVRAAIAGGTLPFAGSSSLQRVAELRDAAIANEPTCLAGGVVDRDETMALPTAALAGDELARSLGEVLSPELSVDHYAALSVELEVKGPSAEVLRRHEIPTAASLEALHAAQERRMNADPARRARFEERRAHFLRFARRP